MYHLDPDKEHNFFTMMCEVLGIRVILAHSPQAKGRVERYNGVHQRRLIPLMKLDGVQDMESANKYLEQYVSTHNKIFSKPARNGNAHTPLPDWAKDVDDVCFVEVQRTINNDWTVCYKSKIYHPNVPPPSKNVPLKKLFQDISPSHTEPALSLIFCLSKLSKFKWVLTALNITFSRLWSYLRLTTQFSKMCLVVSGRCENEGDYLYLRLLIAYGISDCRLRTLRVKNPTKFFRYDYAAF